MNPTLRLLVGAGALFLLASCASGSLPFASCSFSPPAPRSTDALQRISFDRGIGGSGISNGDRGLGGSGVRAGIIGVVTGFGSLCVNGYEIELDETSVVTLEGRRASEADIHLGQLVVVEADQSRGNLRAARVDVRLAVMGPVEKVDASGASFTVLGQTVRLSEIGAKTGEKVSAGDWVAVSGLRDRDAVIEGTSVVKLPQAGTFAMVGGTVRDGRVGGLAIGPQAPAPGETVVVELRAKGQALQVVQVHPQPQTFSADVREVSVQTFVPGERLLGLSISPTGAPAPSGKPVQLEGRLVAGNTVVPNRTVVPDLPREGQFAVRNILMDRDAIFRGVSPAGPVLPALVPPTLPTETRPTAPPPL